MLEHLIEMSHYELGTGFLLLFWLVSVHLNIFKHASFANKIIVITIKDSGTYTLWYLFIQQIINIGLHQDE